MPEESKSEIARNAVFDSATALTGGLIGLAIGGPPGAAIGAVLPPALSAAVRITSSAVQRKLQRAEKIVQGAAEISGRTVPDFEELILADADKTDLFASALSAAMDSRDDIRTLYTALLAELAIASSELEVDRIQLIVKALRDLDRTQLRIMIALSTSGKSLTPSQISDALGIPAVELRGSVRDLEARGIIKDIGEGHVEWKLRELGQSINELLGRCDTIESGVNDDELP